MFGLAGPMPGEDDDAHQDGRHHGRELHAGRVADADLPR